MVAAGDDPFATTFACLAETELIRENNFGGGEVRIKTLANKFHDSDTQRRKNESPAKDRR